MCFFGRFQINSKTARTNFVLLFLVEKKITTQIYLLWVFLFSRGTDDFFFLFVFCFCVVENATVAKSRSLFDDPAEKIEELTSIIKEDINSIKSKIAALQSLAASQRRQHPNEQSHTHSGTIIDSLSDQLMTTTKQFQKVLEIRTEVRCSSANNSSYVLSKNKKPKQVQRLSSHFVVHRACGHNRSAKKSTLAVAAWRRHLGFTSPTFRFWKSA